MRQSVMRVIAAWFDRDVDAEAAREELGDLHAELDVSLRFRRIDELVDPVGAHPVLIARVAAAQMSSVRRVVARHRGQIVIDLDERHTGS